MVIKHGFNDDSNLKLVVKPVIVSSLLEIKVGCGVFEACVFLLCVLSLCSALALVLPFAICYHIWWADPWSTNISQREH